jgi:putative peptidoglycan lipid II flippase
MSIARTSLGMASGTIASRILGVVRASLLGTVVALGAAGDAFTVANTLPNVIYLVIAGGVLNSVLVPQLVKAAKNPDGGEEFTNRLLTLATTAMLAITVLATVLAAVLVKIMAKDFTPEVYRLAVAFAVICLPQIFFYGIYALLGQVLNARGRLLAFGWAPAAANVVAIAALVLFPLRYAVQQPPEKWTSEMIWLLAGSATLSVIVQSLVVVAALWRSGFRYRPVWGVRGVGLRATSTVAGWAFAALLVAQGGYVILTNVLSRATAADEAAASVQSSAMLIFMLPHSLAALSLITALYPRMSAAIRDGDSASLKRDYRRGIVVPSAVTLPAMVGWAIIALPAIKVLFAVPESQQRATALAAAIMLLGVVPFGVDVLNQRVFYALEEGRTAFRVQVLLTAVATLINLSALLLDPSLTVPIAAGGLVVSNLASSSVGAWLVRRRVGLLDGRRIFRSLARILAASVGAGLIAWPVMSGLTRLLPDSRVGNLLAVCVVAAFFAIAYLLLVYILRIRDVLDILEPVLGRVPGLARLVG